MRLDKLLQKQGFGTRSACRTLIEQGRVQLSGIVVFDPKHEVESDGLDFEVDGESWQSRDLAYLMMHKPVHHECSHRPQHHPSVYSLLPLPLQIRGVQSVGRLDEDTSGLLLFTDDGQFIHTYTSPRKTIGKTYEVRTRHPVTEADATTLLAGVELHDEPRPIMATRCEIVDEFHLRLVVTEGKYHMVKRMVAAIGNRVESLHRSAIGNLDLPDDLPAGAWRWLSDDDLRTIGWR